MKKTLLFVCAIIMLLTATAVFAQSAGTITIQTNSATNIQNYSATLNGYFGVPYISSSNYVWFQWGTDTNYYNSTNQQYLGSSGFFSQNISGLSANTTYHFRAVVQSNGSTTYGQDMTFYTSSSGYYYGNGTLTVGKKVINLTSGNLNWQTSVNANQGDILTFAITMQAGNQDIHNVFVRDILPSGLLYRGNLTVNASINNSGNISSGINVGTIPANGVVIISYQTQVISSAYLNTTISNSATITSNEAGTQTAFASVLINNSTVYVPGVTYIPTGLTNNPIKDSFLLPMLLILLGSWLYFSGKIYTFADWLAKKI